MEVLRPWQSFLRQVSRRFLMRGFVSDPIQSSSGFAKGCPLSTVAMAISNLLYHRYLEVFQPRLLSMSFVDNLTCVSDAVGGELGATVTCLSWKLMNLRLLTGRFSLSRGRNLQCLACPSCPRHDSWVVPCLPGLLQTVPRAELFATRGFSYTFGATRNMWSRVFRRLLKELGPIRVPAIWTCGDEWLTLLQ